MSTQFYKRCQLAHGPGGDTILASPLRESLLFSTTGMCRARRILSMEDGSFLPAKEICNESTYALVKQKSIFELIDWKTFRENARRLEHVALTKLKRALEDNTRLQELNQLAETHKDDCKAFRKSLLESHVLGLRIIHVCRWDGTPRKSIAEIRDAICLYPANPLKFKGVVKYLLEKAARTVLGHKLYEPLGYKLPPGAHIVRMKGDGNCLFHAIGDQINETHVVVRKKIVQYMKTHADMFAPYLEEEYETFDKYLKHMARPRTFGGDKELMAAANVYNATIVVHAPDGHVHSFAPDNAAPAMDIHLVYSTMDVDEGHYDSVRLEK